MSDSKDTKIQLHLIFLSQVGFQFHLEQYHMKLWYALMEFELLMVSPAMCIALNVLDLDLGLR